MAKRNALGRGLGALIDDADKIMESASSAPSVNEIEIYKIEANPYQPRTRFDDEALQELSNSIKEFGIIQPITLRKFNDSHYQIIAGERRFRASKLAGLTSIPAYVREADDDGMLEMALIENIQREDLDAIEIALSYQRLIDECKLTQENLGDRVGKKRSTVTNYLRLLRLPAPIQKGIRDREISMGHARALINIEDQDTQTMIFQQIIKYDFSVRKVEEIVRNLNNEQPAESVDEENANTTFPEEYHELKTHLSRFFQSKIDFKINEKGKGKIVIPFKSTHELEKIIGILDKLKS
ncbi:MAG: ParB/RepB/Spo0J family partition protein [Bacteroidota bacterium]|nr:ParB/RepB/Spo0J family partition protein [Bacteroidota bacterium]MDP4205400.1 ParB/RepB/Spo0J family partition protein [Bacteroidota bacterium]